MHRPELCAETGSLPVPESFAALLLLLRDWASTRHPKTSCESVLTVTDSNTYSV